MRLHTTLLFVLILTSSTLMAQEVDTDKLFYQAVYAEQIDGDLEKARSLYQQIIKANPTDRTIMAKTLYRLGLITEKDGAKQALGFYTKVVEEYPEQKDLIQLVQSRVNKLGDANTFVDPRDGHKYKWVKIGNQIWMAENLAYMPWVNPPKKQEDGIWVYDYEGEDVAEAKATDNYQKYGCLYDWAMAMNIDTKYLRQPWDGNSDMHQGICPPGWHLPTDAEWRMLEKSVGLVDSLVEVDDDFRPSEADFSSDRNHYLPIGQLLKSSTGWYNQGNGQNFMQFSVLPAGNRVIPSSFVRRFKSFERMGYLALFWTASDSSWDARARGPQYSAYYRMFSSRDLGVYRGPHAYRTDGYSVRCLKDDSEAPVAGNSIKKLSGPQPSPTKKRNIVSVQTNNPIFYKKYTVNEGTPSKYAQPTFRIDGDVLYLVQQKSKTILAIDTNSSDTIWTCQLDEEIQVNSNFLTSEKILIGQSNKKIFGINKSDGKVQWHRMGSYGLAYNSRVKDNVIYTAVQDTILALNIDSGKVIWSHYEEKAMPYYPDIHDNRLYYPLFIKSYEERSPGSSASRLRSSFSNLIAINIINGKKVWEYEGTGTFGECTYNYGSVYIALSNNERGNYLYGIDTVSNKVNSRLYLNTSAINSRISVSDNEMYLLSTDYSRKGYAICFEQDGSMKWKTELTPLGMLRNQSPVLYDNKLFFLTGQSNTINKLVALDSKTGTKKYIFDLPIEPTTYPVLQNDKIYIGGKDGLYIYHYPKIN